MYGIGDTRDGKSATIAESITPGSVASIEELDD
jgi:hypothetical protein